MPTLERLDADALRRIVLTFRDGVHAHAPRINRLNVYPVPDGDTGTNMARTLDAVVAELDGAASGLDATCDAISHGSLMGARGNSGVILSQILRGLAAGLKGDAADAPAASFAAALSAASAAAYQAVLRPVEGTILTVVRAAAEAATKAAGDGAELVAVLRAAQAAAVDALASTPDLLPVLKDAGVVDAGGTGFLLLLDAALHVVAGDPMPEVDEGDLPDAARIQAASARHAASAHEEGERDISELRYEVMYLLDLADERIGAFKDSWGAIGDSIVVVGGDGLWNCHVHTDDIGAAIEAALDLDGRPRRIRITDLLEEAAEEHLQREAQMTSGAAGSPSASVLPPVTTAVVAVASGPGLIELFGNLGVQGVVGGGQTLNPSTAELLAAVEAVNADQVVVLPNNKNIIAVAEQLDALTAKRVVVVPTTSMPEALAALVVYDPELGADANREAMGCAAGAVHAGEITRAVRDTAGAVPVSAGDWIGIVRGDGIVSAGPSLHEVAGALLDQLVTDDREIVTVVTGADAVPRDTEALRAWLAERHPHVDVEVHSGGQPLYPYLFGVE